MLSQKLTYLAARLRLDPADPHLPAFKPATLADILDAAAADAAALEATPLALAQTQPTHIRIAHRTPPRPRLVADGNIVHLIPAHRRTATPRLAPQDGAA